MNGVSSELRSLATVGEGSEMVSAEAIDEYDMLDTLLSLVSKGTLYHIPSNSDLVMCRPRYFSSSTSGVLTSVDGVLGAAVWW